MSPALAGGLLSTEPRGKPPGISLFKNETKQKISPEDCDGQPSLSLVDAFSPAPQNRPNKYTDKWSGSFYKGW